jgi:predicted ATP-binding protein involved in virulence
MKLKSITIKNFGAFVEEKIDLYGKSTVFFGINGTGKSTLLRIISLLYSPILSGLVNKKGFRQYNPEISDIRYGSQETFIEAEYSINEGVDEQIYRFSRQVSRTGGKKILSKIELEKIVSTLKKQSDSSELPSVPIFVNYGTNRLVWDIPLRIRSHHEFDIFSAYEKAIENRIDFRTFFEWYRNQEDEENSIKVNEADLDYEDKLLKAVRTAIYIMLPEMRNLHIARRPKLAMVIEKNGMRLNIAQLSDGEKCIIALLGDLARRLAIANPKMENPLEGSGVALIDEIELHMHPSWQRNILNVLKKAFPNIQFIITTHSPQVLGEVDDSYNLFAVKTNDSNTANTIKMRRFDGYDSNYILEEFMGTSSSNLKKKNLIKRINVAISDGLYENAENDLEVLKEISGEMDEEYILAKGFLDRQRRIYVRDQKNGGT